MNKITYSQWLQRSVEIMYSLRNLKVTAQMKAVIILPDDIIDTLVSTGDIEIKGRSKMYPFDLDGSKIYLKVRGCGPSQTKMQVKITR